MTLLCVPILVHDEAPAHADAIAARDAGADLVEFRVDEFFSGDEPERETAVILRLLANSPLPCILTCRIAAEGGGYSGDEADRIALFERVANTLPTSAEHPPRYIDVEFSAFHRSANVRQKVKLAVEHPEQRRDLETGLILSMHDFEGRPTDLHRRLMAMSEERAAAVVKVAYRARSLRDSVELLDLPRTLHRPTIALGMGKFGFVTRVLAPKFGGFVTFASLRQTTTTAPGQPTVQELLETFRFRSIRGSTQVFGVVGWPLEQSLSPRIHNAGFEAIGFDGVLVPMPIAADSADPEGSYASFKATMLELLHHSSLDFRGCAVTIPHKEHLLRLARESGWRIGASANAVGAANTLVCRHDHLELLNTDAPAAAKVLGEALGGLSGKTIAVLGAGGMARAAAFACLDAGGSVVVCNRNPGRAKSLVESLRPTLGERVEVGASLAGRRLDAMINCTPAGMVGGGAEDQCPVDLAEIANSNPGVVVVDAVYKPRMTPLLQRAGALGLKAVDGVGLFLAQAAIQFEAWTGRPAPLGVFAREVDRALCTRQGGEA